MDGFAQEMLERGLTPDKQDVCYIGLPHYLRYVVEECVYDLTQLDRPGYSVHGNAFDRAVEAMEREQKKSAAIATPQGNTHTPSIADVAIGEQDEVPFDA